MCLLLVFLLWLKGGQISKQIWGPQKTCVKMSRFTQWQGPSYSSHHMSRATTLHECHLPKTQRPSPSSLNYHSPLHVANNTIPLPMDLNPITTCEMSRVYLPLPQLFIAISFITFELFIAIVVACCQSTVAFGSTLVSSPTMNVHWQLVFSDGNCSDQWPVALWITPQSQLAKFSFLDGGVCIFTFRATMELGEW